MLEVAKCLDERNYLETIRVRIGDDLGHVRLTVRVVRRYIPDEFRARIRI